MTLLGILIAALAIPPLRDIGLLTPSKKLRRAWSALSYTIVACLSLRTVAAIVRLRSDVDVSDVLDAFVHLLGPMFVLAVAYLSRSTAQEILRLTDLAEASMTDALTGLANRRQFDTRLEAEIARFRANGGSLHLILIDIDHFKRLNDAFGHAAGDVILKTVADLLKGSSRRSDLACRIGGDELAVIAPELSDDVATFAERLRLNVERASLSIGPGMTTRAKISLGAAAAGGGDTTQSLFSRADAALYSAKRAGRNQARLAA